METIRVVYYIGDDPVVKRCEISCASKLNVRDIRKILADKHKVSPEIVRIVKS